MIHRSEISEVARADSESAESAAVMTNEVEKRGRIDGNTSRGNKQPNKKKRHRRIALNSNPSGTPVGTATGLSHKGCVGKARPFYDRKGHRK